MSFANQRLAALLISSFLLLTCSKLITKANKTEDVWRTAGRLTGLLIWNCMQSGSDGPQEQFLLILQKCLKRRSLAALDNSLKADVIRVANGVELVRYKMENETHISRDPTFLRSYKSNKREFDWKYQILQRIAHVLNTHVLKIRLNSYEEMGKFISEEGRGRKRQQNMFMSLLMFGVLAVGLVMVPMGFQFLAVLGGKALLLAKMALILTAIQGLKKIATSNFNYGLYATPEHHRPWAHDRELPYDHEPHETGYNHNYRVPEQQSDGYHPLFPRIDTHRTMM